MKKPIAIFFLSLYLFSTTEANQLLKMPLIFEHFKEHKALNKDLSFIQFLDIHYMHQCPKGKDNSKDMQLPFKTVSHSIFSISSAIVPTTAKIKWFIQLDNIQKIKSNLQNQFLLSTYLSNIWQPPRIC